MRAFVGIPVTEEVKDNLTTVRNDCVNYGKMNPVDKENLHWTVKFLGEIDESQKEEVSKSLRALKTEENSFSVDVEGVGVFPSPSKPRVVWAGSNSNRFVEFLESADRIISEAGFEPEDRDQVPHVTLARIKFLNDKVRFRKFLEKNKSKHFGTMKIEDIVLYESNLTSEGPVYEVLESVTLDG